MVHSIGFGSLLLLATTSLAFPLDLYNDIMLERRADPNPPRALPQKATTAQLKFQPAMDFDTDGCYNVPAIDAQGNVVQGLDHVSTLSGGCHDLSDLQNNNVYVRTRCNTGWCVHVYDYYFEKDVAVQYFAPAGHRHDWEHVVVWTQNDQIRGTATSAHGKYTFKTAGSYRTDRDVNHAKVIYHKDGASTHAFRFANEDDDRIENQTGAWFYGPLIDYGTGFPSLAVRDKLMSHDFGKASIAIKDSGFQSNIESSRPSGFAPGFNAAVDG